MSWRPRISLTVGMLIAALMLVVSSASATIVTSPTGTTGTPSIKAESEGHVVFDFASGLPKIECSSLFEGTIESHGEKVPAAGKLNVLTFTGCTNSWHVTVVAGGSIEVNWTSGYDGQVLLTGTTFEATRFGITCRFATNKTVLGTLKGGSPATIKIEKEAGEGEAAATIIPLHTGSSPLCGTAEAPVKLTKSYALASPSSLFVDKGEEVIPPSGATFTSSTGTVATPTIKAESESHVTLDHPIANIQCNWTFEGTTKSHGLEQKAKVALSSLSTTGCTESWHGTTTTAGELEVEWTSGYNGTVTWNGATVEMTRLGTICQYKSENTKLGTITGGSPATIDIEAKLPFHSGSPLCGSEAYSLTGNFKVTSPSSLYVDKGFTPHYSLTSPTGTGVTPTIKAASEGHVTLDHPIANIQCEWALEGTTESHSAEAGATVPLSSLSTTGCTESWHGTTVAAGKLIIKPSSGYNGTVTWDGATVEMTRLGTTCRYKTSSTKLGTLTGGSPATIDLEMKLPFHGGSPLCGEEAYSLTGSIKVTSPSSLYVDS